MRGRGDDIAPVTELEAQNRALVERELGFDAYHQRVANGFTSIDGPTLHRLLNAAREEGRAALTKTEERI